MCNQTRRAKGKRKVDKGERLEMKNPKQRRKINDNGKSVKEEKKCTGTIDDKRQTKRTMKIKTNETETERKRQMIKDK